MSDVQTKWAGPESFQPLEELRWIVVDVETTGLNLRKDRVIAIGGAEIISLRINLLNSFERVFDPGVEMQKDNVLIHGLSPQELQQGVTPQQALTDFFRFACGAPVLAFHAGFDKHMLEKESKKWLGVSARLPCYDLAEWCPALFPESGLGMTQLDPWLDYFGLDAGERHHATCDAMVTAELALICLQKARSLGMDTWGELRDKVANFTRLSRARATL